MRAFSDDPRLSRDDRLHLSVSMRSFRSEKVSEFVKAALDRDRIAASDLLRQMTPKYPVALTRDLRRAKEWIRSHARGTERYGLVAATEFQIQGLELDWVCVTWDADLRLQSDSWSYHAFRGDAWTTIRDSNRKRYLLNAYRVLLTRARQGMVIFVPEGDDADPTRARTFYDQTFAYLSALGIEAI